MSNDNCCNDLDRFRVALAHVSGALCDAGDVVVPDDERKYGEAVREITRKRDEARHLLDLKTQQYESACRGVSRNGDKALEWLKERDTARQQFADLAKLAQALTDHLLDAQAYPMSYGGKLRERTAALVAKLAELKGGAT